METATFTFDADLCFFLPRKQQRQAAIVHAFDGRASIKDRVESLGVPHVEIESLVVNDVPVDFDYIVQPDDRVQVNGPHHPVPAAVSLRPPFPGRPRFVLDVHLGRLAAYLRMMGFDTLYRNDFDDDELAQISHDETRILLTRDVGVLKRSLVIYGCYVRATHRDEQIIEISQRYGLADQVEPFQRCMACNGVLHPVDKAAVMDQLPPRTAQYYERFHQCESCGRVFWKGGHFQRMQTLLDAVLNENR